MKKKHKMGGHKAHHEMTGHADGIMGKDKLAHDTHHAANTEHGMAEGIGPQGGYEQGPTEGEMGCNEEHE